MEERQKPLRIGAWQFPVSGHIQENYDHILKGIEEAEQKEVRLLIFPECALTGYPPLSIPDSNVDFGALEKIYARLQQKSDETGISLLVGSITKEGEARRDSALLFSPHAPLQRYDKRALGGWDSIHFTGGTGTGLFTVDGFRIAVRICFEVRFPELFREIYREGADLCLLLFHDTLSADDPEYYEIIKSHLRSRAAENVLPLLSVNATAPVQAAPTAFFSSDGRVLSEADRGRESMLICDFSGREISGSGQRRAVWIDRFAGSRLAGSDDRKASSV